MKKQSLLKSFFLAFGLVLVSSLSAQVIITGVTDSTAMLNETFTATMVWSPGTGGAPSWNLPLKPSGMSINSSGVITYTPTLQNDGGRVVVEATNSNGTAQYHFNVYISDGVACDPDLVSYYQLNESGTSFTDFAGGYDGTSATSLSSVPGKVGNAVSMSPADEEAEFIEVTDVDQYEWSTLDGFSFSAWINPAGKLEPTVALDQVLWGRLNSLEDNGIIIGLDGQTASNELRPKFRVIANGVAVTEKPDIVLPLDSMFHIGFVYSPEGGGPVRMRVYLNGQRMGNPQYYVNPADNFYADGNAGLGNLPYPTLNTRFPFNGIMDEALIYSKALSDAQMLEIFNDGMAGEAHCKPGNHAPEFVNNFPSSIDQGGTYDITLVTNDIESDPVTITADAYPDWMSYNSGTKRLTNKAGRPNNDDVGVHEIDVSANDGTITVVRTFPITVVNVNDDPEFTSSQGNASIDEDVEFTYSITFEDVDVGDDVTLSAPTKPDWLTLNTVANTLTGTCTNDFLGTNASVVFPVTLRVEDLAGAFDEQSFDITVNNVNDAPVISGQNTIETPEFTPILITPSVAFSAGHIDDPDDVFPGDFELTVNAGTNYTVSGVGNNVLTPVEHFSGQLTVPISLSDGQASVSYDLTVMVDFVNVDPVITSDPDKFADDYELYEYTMTVTDGNPSDVLVMNDSILPSWLTFDTGTGYLSGTPLWDDIGDTIAILTVTDGHVTIVHPISISVLNTNSLPEITSTPATEWTVGSVYQYNMTATDVDEDDALTFTAITKPDWLTFTPEATQALLHGVPTGDNVGTHPISLQVSDGAGIDLDNFNLVILPLGIEDEKLSTLRVYPTPATTELNIDYDGVMNDAVFQILNLNGRILTHESLEYNSGKLTVDISEFNTGMYIYRIIQGDAVVTGKFLVE